MNECKVIGPFAQLVTMQNLPVKGALKDDQLEILTDVYIAVEQGKIKAIGTAKNLENRFPESIKEVLPSGIIGLPGYIDAHTHICFAGSRSRDYRMRNAGISYLEIAKAGGGIWDTVQKTRAATQNDLQSGIMKRAEKLLKNGITTIEVKSGYGLSVIEELKMLFAIKEANKSTNADLISTCLAAHIKPKDFTGSPAEYLDHISNALFPILKEENLTNRIDAFIEEEAFTPELTMKYFEKAKEMGFDITVHADQFHPGGSKVAVDIAALSADHLEASTDNEISLLANSDVVSMALPGASIGLGCAFTPARKILDQGGALAIASDWNPGSAPMGDLITQACILGTFQKLSNTELLAGITFRAAKALGVENKGRLQEGYEADIVGYAIDDVHEIFYKQGQIKPSLVIKSGKLLS